VQCHFTKAVQTTTVDRFTPFIGCQFDAATYLYSSTQLRNCTFNDVVAVHGDGVSACLLEIVDCVFSAYIQFRATGLPSNVTVSPLSGNTFTSEGISPLQYLEGVPVDVYSPLNNAYDNAVSFTDSVNITVNPSVKFVQA